MSERSAESTLVSHRNVGEVAVLTAAVLLLAVLGYTVLPVLTPFVLVAAVVYLLFPLRHQPLPARLVGLAVGLFSVWFVYTVLPILTPFIIAFVVAYLCNPVVKLLERGRVPRWLASLLVVLVLIGTVVAALLFLMPVVLGQFQAILAKLSLIARDVSQLLKSGLIFDVLAPYGIPVETAREMIEQHLTPGLESALKTLFEGVLGFFTGLSDFVLQILNAVIIPFLVFYILWDLPLIKERFVQFFPAGRRPGVEEFWGRVDRLLGQYIRGAIIVAAVQGTISAMALWIIGVPYALILGIMTGLLNFIPYVGLITSLLVSCIVALFSGEPVLVKVIAIIAVYLSQKVLEATILAPRIIGSQVGVHPVLLILCLLVFGYFLGFVGLLIAVPATALLVALFREWEERRAAEAGTGGERP